MNNIRVEIKPPAEVPYLWVCPYLSFYLVIANHKIKDEVYISQLFLNKEGRILLLFTDTSFIPFEDVMAVFKTINGAMDYINDGRPFIDREKLEADFIKIHWCEELKDSTSEKVMEVLDIARNEDGSTIIDT